MEVNTEAEATARLFHETYERLAPSFCYETRKESAVPWEDVPANNRALMVAVVSEVESVRRAKVSGLLIEAHDLIASTGYVGSADRLHDIITELGFWPVPDGEEAAANG